MLRIFLALWLAITPAFAWAGSMTLMGVGVVSSAPPAFSLTFGQDGTSTTSSTTINYGTLTYGSGCTRVIAAVLDVSSNTAAAFTQTGVTIGGNSLSAVAGTSIFVASGQGEIGFWESTGPISGSSGAVSVTYSLAPSPFSQPSNVALYCLVTTTPAVSGVNTGSGFSTSISKTLAVPTGGAGIVAAANGNLTSFTSFTNASTDASPGSGQAIGKVTSTGSVSVTANYSGNDALVISMASWGP